MGADDFSAIPTTIPIANGSTSGSVSFTIADDGVIEGTDVARFTIGNPSAGITLGSTTSQLLTIADNDFPTSLFRGYSYTDNGIFYNGSGLMVIDLPVTFPIPVPIFGTINQDSLKAGAGNDRVVGFAGNDTLEGRQGNDTIIGGSGEDIIQGASGSNEIDILIGGADSDKFVLGVAGSPFYTGDGQSGYALILDFETIDRIQVTTIPDINAVALPPGIFGTALSIGGDLIAVVQGATPDSGSFVTV